MQFSNLFLSVTSLLALAAANPIAAIPARAASAAPAPTSVEAVPAKPSATCTTTVVKFPPPFDLSQTTTVYKHTVTTTSFVDCEGCALVTSTFRFGPGPVIPGGKTATVTKPRTTEGAYACLPSANY